MTNRRLPAILLLCLAALFLSAASGAPSALPSRAPTPPAPGDRARIIALVGEAVAAHTEVAAFNIYEVKVEEVLFSADGNWALATLAYLEPGTHEPIAAEPGIALGRRLGADWAVTLQADKDWDAVLGQAPEDLVSADTRKQFTTPSAAEKKAMAKALGGYHLPWPAGGTKLLTQSVNHSSSMAYAFDFYDPAQPMWPIVAARTGTVKYAVWTYPNGYYDGNANHLNYLVLEDTSTVPTTYQVYLHLAQDSIPAAFRTPGARVYRGQFLGIADDTGFSTGHHLHFQVHTNSSSYWGNSIDITFDDVAINGGRPRRVDEAKWFGGQGQDYYVSQNKSGTDFVAPTAGITAPADQTAVSTSTVRLQGYAADSGSGFSHGYFIVNKGSGWEQAGPIQTSSPVYLRLGYVRLGRRGRRGQHLAPRLGSRRQSGRRLPRPALDRPHHLLPGPAAGLQPGRRPGRAVCGDQFRRRVRDYGRGRLRQRRGPGAGGGRRGQVDPGRRERDRDALFRKQLLRPDRGFRMPTTARLGIIRSARIPSPRCGCSTATPRPARPR